MSIIIYISFVRSKKYTLFLEWTEVTCLDRRILSKYDLNGIVFTNIFFRRISKTNMDILEFFLAMKKMFLRTIFHGLRLVLKIRKNIKVNLNKIVHILMGRMRK